MKKKKKNVLVGLKFLVQGGTLLLPVYCNIINRPGVAVAVLQTPVSLID